MNNIYLVDGKPHRLCDCPPREGKCKFGRERTLQTAQLSQCFVPAPDVLIVGTTPTEELSKLTKPAQVGNTIFNVGVSERMVVERAQREHEYQQTPENEAERMKRVEAFRAVLAEPVVTDTMVDRFLSWKLPEDFRPDAGISFKREYNEGTPYPGKHQPVGTNLLNADQARKMLEHVLACAVSPPTRRSEPE